ncbi:hypothetical protein CDD80_3254 [Ophiocordyceps camponoti-rufipedis]|uniref:Actin cytoskeleton-regulatory complex protein SLA1 n=1 Tax=Ophiocordyceps camponoti-rufipedis TaxID=2004952 RepID=A0A2C5XWB4_9HYPO|nr:hypothetical protein CDD80_3254 [Ophiocordyceps camponoti-rufipedis]
MGFLGVYRAIYDYSPQGEGELTFDDGDLLYILDKNDDDGWWKAKRKAGASDEDEPEGLVPNNYVEPATALSQARAIYEYTRQTDEELSFPEDALLQIYDTSDPDWILAGHEDEYGFVPSNYIEVQDTTSDAPTAPRPAVPVLPQRPLSGVSEQSESAAETSRVSPPESPASTVMHRRPSHPLTSASNSTAGDGKRDSRTPISEAEDEDEALKSPSLPPRPQPQIAVPDRRSRGRSPYPVSHDISPADDTYRTPGGFHLYNINEMVSVMGKRKKMPTTLGVNLKTGTILIAAEHGQDDPAQEWTAEKMTHYSREGKHVFMELVRPSKSIDFHAGAKDTAEEIVAALGELAGAVRAEGLREVMSAASQNSRRHGQVQYDFMAQGDDEVSVAAGDEVLILDDSKSDEWWQVRSLKNGKEGVVPSSYIEVMRNASLPPAGTGSRTDSVRSTIEQNRLEEIRLTKEAVRASKESQQRGRRDQGRRDSQSKSKTRPDSSKIKTWTDRTGSFSVEAQFLGLKDGKIQLHKTNGVKIAVPVAKMSRGDLEYVENVTGLSLEDEKPLADVKRAIRPADKRLPEVGASVGEKEKPEYDWFQFFLSCDVAIGLCERYAQAFVRDSMDESVLPDVNATILRTLGLREGDIIKVMRKLDEKFGRESSKADDGDHGSGGLFSGPGGALRNNTRKSRPAATTQTSDVVDPTALTSPASDSRSPVGKDGSKSPAGKGFEDDAWDSKPSTAVPAKAAQHAPSVAESAPTPTPPVYAGSMKDLSQLAQPLEPIRASPQPSSNPTPAIMNPQHTSTANPAMALPQNASSPQALARQRPLPPSMSPSQSSLKPPVLQRPSSAPQEAMFLPPRISHPTPSSVQSQVAPPGQSLNDLRLQQQYAAHTAQLQPSMTGYPMLQPQATAAFPTANPGQQHQQFMQPMMTGMPGVSPFADPSQFQSIGSQPTGFQYPKPPQISVYGQNGGVNSFLPPALQPQPTGVAALPLRQAGTTGGLVQPLQPLQPQKTGPPPPVRFGVPADAKGLAPQPTGRRANLSQATPDNPFGF